MSTSNHLTAIDPETDYNPKACTCHTAPLANPLGTLQPPIAELFGSFSAPSPTERVIIRERMLQIRADLSQLDNEMVRATKLLECLRRNHAALTRLLHEHQNVLSPTRRLPVEILGEIFIQWQSTVDGPSIASVQVCRHWRAVAIATSKLWSHLRIVFRSRYTTSNEEMTLIWLRRSGGQPLKIQLGASEIPNWREPGINASTLYGLLKSQAHRWKDVSLNATQPVLSLLGSVLEDLPILHTLYISGPAPASGTGVPPISLGSFQNLSALRVLTLSGRLSSFIPDFPWVQLNKCTLKLGGHYTCQEVYHLLSQAVNLEHYAMEVRIALPRSPTPPPIRHANLISLDIVAFSAAHIYRLLDVLSLPALTHFKLRETMTRNTPDCLAALITRSGCSLKKIHLKYYSISSTHDELLNLFNLTPMLSELELLGDSTNDSLLHLLTHHANHAAGACCLLPQLTSVKFSIHSGLSYETYAIFLSSRRPDSVCDSDRLGLAPLSVAVLDTSKDTFSASGRPAHRLPWEIYYAFVALRNDGLDLHVIDGDVSISLEQYFVPGEEDESNEAVDAGENS